MVPVPCVGPFGTAVERVGTFYYSRKQKREILGDAGLQHVVDTGVNSRCAYMITLLNTSL